MSVDAGKLREVFDEFDADKSGSISCKEIENILKQCGIEEGKCCEIAQKIMADGDADGDKKITFEEFQAACAE